MSENTQAKISTEKLQRRRKIGLVIVWLLYIITAADLIVVGYLISDGQLEIMQVFTLVFIPLAMGLIILMGVKRAAREIKRREEEGES